MQIRDPSKISLENSFLLDTEEPKEQALVEEKNRLEGEYGPLLQRYEKRKRTLFKWRYPMSRKEIVQCKQVRRRLKDITYERKCLRMPAWEL